MLVHILNGDALGFQLKEAYTPYIVMKECMMEGPASATNEDDFWNKRASYLKKYNKDNHEINYALVRNEIQELNKLPQNASICLWFEFDVFCQANMWFIIHYIHTYSSIRNISWVYPDHDEWSGFGKMNKESLDNSFNQRRPLSLIHQAQISELWQNHCEQLQFKMLHSDLFTDSFFRKLRPTVSAFINLHSDKSENIVTQQLKAILANQPDISFGKLFKLFSEELGIYGYGDLQLLHLYNNLKNKPKSSNENAQ